MIKSMTAFARAEKTAGQLTVAAEIRSYNSKFIDIVPRLSHGYQDLEEKIKGLIAQSVARGRIEIKIQIINESQETCAFDINTSKAQAYYEALVRLKNQFNINAGISLDNLANISGIITPAEAKKDMEACWSVTRECLNDALEDLVSMRRKEGEFIAKDITVRLEYIEKCLDHIRKESVDVLKHYQERLKERIVALTQGLVEIDPARVAQEAAFIADRSDISEEIVRAQSHIKHFREIMDAAAPAGRKLNFLLQELNREFNTMGAKTENIDVSHVIVEIKAELEKIREQIQNIE
ncbi:MAG: YicC family protein, partial [Proteobacteria bacterium]|nr:YicC family protein [Pseudomonadota bacterium]